MNAIHDPDPTTGTPLPVRVSSWSADPAPAQGSLVDRHAPPDPDTPVAKPRPNVKKVVAMALLAAGVAVMGLGAGVANAAPGPPHIPAPPVGPSSPTKIVPDGSETVTIVGSDSIALGSSFTVDLEGWEPGTGVVLAMDNWSVGRFIGGTAANGLFTLTMPAILLNLQPGPHELLAGKYPGAAPQARCPVFITVGTIRPLPGPGGRYVQ